MSNPNRRFKDAVYEQFSRIGKAVSSPKRLELLDILCQGERTVELLANESKLTIANTSQHLQVLLASRLVEKEKEGQFVKYRLVNRKACEFFLSMRVLAEDSLAELEQIKRRFLEGREGMIPVDKDALLKQVQSGEVTVLDLRPKEEYQAGHIPGAISIPLKKLKDRLAGLPRDQKIVAYCRGPYCVLAVQAVDILRAKGFNAVRLEEGMPDWRKMGLEIAVGG